jgi:glycosyltransferase involved in cell wall biosynthesis
MKIAFIGGRLSHRASGVKVVVEELSRALQRQGHDVRVFGLADEAWHNADHADWNGAPASLFTTRGPAGFGYAPGLKAALHGFAPDLVHAHGLWMYGSLVSANLARKGVANVVSPHGMLDTWALKRSRIRKLIVTTLFERGHLNRASCIHALNTEEIGAVRNFGLTAPVAVLPNGVDLSAADTTASDTPDWRQRLPKDAQILLYLGRLHAKKNLGPLLAAWPKVPTHWHLVIAGPDEGGYRAKLDDEISRLSPNAAQRVHFLGPLFGASKSAALRNADAFVLPSLSEGLPVAVLEAWSYRLPVAMTANCNLPVGFTEGAAVEIGINAKDIAPVLADFLALPTDQRTAIGNNGYDLVARDYSWDGVAAQFSELYQWCKINDNATPKFLNLADESNER